MPFLTDMGQLMNALNTGGPAALQALGANFSGVAPAVRTFARTLPEAGLLGAMGSVASPYVERGLAATGPAVAGLGAAYGLDAVGLNPVAGLHSLVVGETPAETWANSQPESQFGPAMAGKSRYLLGHVKAKLHLANQDPMNYRRHMDNLRDELLGAGFKMPEIVSLYRAATGDHLASQDGAPLEAWKWGAGGPVVATPTDPSVAYGAARRLDIADTPFTPGDAVAGW